MPDNEHKGHAPHDGTSAVRHTMNQPSPPTLRNGRHWLERVWMEIAATVLLLAGLGLAIWSVLLTSANNKVVLWMTG